MSTTAKVDFEPSLFGDDQPEVAPDLPTSQPKRRTNRAPFIMTAGLLLVLAVAFFAATSPSKSKSVPAMPIEGPQTATGTFSLPTITEEGSQNIPVSVRKDTASEFSRFCTGYESLCSTSTTENPAETLVKMAAALPAGKAKRYRVEVSVLPLGE